MSYGNRREYATREVAPRNYLNLVPAVRSILGERNEILWRMEMITLRYQGALHGVADFMKANLPNAPRALTHRCLRSNPIYDTRAIASWPRIFSRRGFPVIAIVSRRSSRKNEAGKARDLRKRNNDATSTRADSQKSRCTFGVRARSRKAQDRRGTPPTRSSGMMASAFCFQA